MEGEVAPDGGYERHAELTVSSKLLGKLPMRLNSHIEGLAFACAYSTVSNYPVKSGIRLRRRKRRRRGRRRTIAEGGYHLAVPIQGLVIVARSIVPKI